MSAEEVSELVEAIQESTRGMSHEQRIATANAWEWMARELRRVCACEQSRPQPSHLGQPEQLELWV